MYYYGPIVQVVLYENDLVVKRQGVAPQTKGETRKDITTFSKESRKRLAFVASNTSVAFTTMITLTYPKDFPSDGKKVRRDRKAFLDWLRRDQGGLEYLWFLEFQKRGAPHLHFLTSQLWPRTRTAEKALRFRVATTWYRIVGSKDRKHLAAGTRTERLRSARGGAFYAVKYAMKMRQKVVPKDYVNCGRFWGHSKKVKPEKQGTMQCTEDDIRGLLEGWDYAPKDTQHVYRVLYNARPILDAFTSVGNPPAVEDSATVGDCNT